MQFVAEEPLRFPEPKKYFGSGYKVASTTKYNMAAKPFVPSSISSGRDSFTSHALVNQSYPSGYGIGDKEPSSGFFSAPRLIENPQYQDQAKVNALLFAQPSYSYYQYL